eukprot:TRINITY_DN38111_c0_g1_i1.p1 TRINITY_DN38111_c0_g1~~TRINITY_DN38111_c0_g1_i1.p1  ORF type:complete len:268 (-),score=5.03 TRINITY_DN38111_c0_g1_i1:325-1128(-)
MIFHSILLLFLHHVASQRNPDVSPVFYYESYGPQVLFNDQGATVPTISGKQYMSNTSLQVCAKMCYGIDQTCQCCNSFSYNAEQQGGTCYLKKRSQIKEIRVHKNNLGWQSFRSWGWSNSQTGYLGSLNVSLGINQKEATQLLDERLFTSAYYTKGPFKVAVDEGTPLNTTSGDYFLEGVDVVECAEECNQSDECNSFAFSSIIEICYLKQVDYQQIGSSTYYNEGGFQTYWLIDQPNDITRNCFCPCQSEFSCVLCDSLNNFCKEY